MKTRLFCVVLLCAVGTGAMGEERVEGAFGLRFGEEFNPAPENGDRVGGPREFRYKFKPKNPFQGLTAYYVDISPRTHRVCGILAIGPGDSEDEAWKLTTLLGILLREKYPSDPIAPEEPSQGRTFARIRFGTPTEVFTIVQGKRAIHVSTRVNEAARGPRRIGEFPDPKPPAMFVSLYYKDEALLAEASKEADLMEAEEGAKAKAAQEAQEKAAKEAAENQRKDLERRRSDLRKQLEAEASKVDSAGL